MPLVLIISRDTDFSHVLAEQLSRELALESVVVADNDAALHPMGQAIAIITDSTAPDNAPVPVLAFPPARRPLRLQRLLADIAAIAEMPAEALRLSEDFRFVSRTRQLINKAGIVAELTDREAELLLALIAANDEGLSRDALLKQLWGFEADINTHTLETHIYRLRSKIRDSFGIEMIEAAEGVYKFTL